MHYKDILVIAMKREEKALEFYNDAARENKNKDHVKMFKVLAQEESKHKLGLEKLYDDYMAGGLIAYSVLILYLCALKAQTIPDY